MISDAGRVNVAPFLDKLRDPVDMGALRLTSDGRLEGVSSGAIYDFVGPFPNLRPGHGHRADGTPILVPNVPPLPHREVPSEQDTGGCPQSGFTHFEEYRKK